MTPNERLDKLEQSQIETARLVAENARGIDENRRQIEENRKQLAETRKLIEANARESAENNRKIADARKQMALTDQHFGALLEQYGFISELVHKHDQTIPEILADLDAIKADVRAIMQILLPKNGEPGTS